MAQQSTPYNSSIPNTTVSIESIARIFSNAAPSEWTLRDLQAAWILLVEGTTQVRHYESKHVTKAVSTAVPRVLGHFYLDNDGIVKPKTTALTIDAIEFVEALQLPPEKAYIVVNAALHNRILSVSAKTDFWEILVTVLRRLPDDRSRVKRSLLCKLSGLKAAAFKHARRRLAARGFYRLCNPPHISRLVHFKSVSKHGACLLVSSVFRGFRAAVRAARNMLDPLKDLYRFEAENYKRDPFEQPPGRWVDVDFERKRVIETRRHEFSTERRTFSWDEWRVLTGEDIAALTQN